MKILIGADFVPTRCNIDLFNIGDISSLIGEELIEAIKDSDYSIFNLECPLTDSLDPIEKCGPNLSAPTSTIFAYKQLGINLLSIANNHIMDQGEKGLFSTIECIEKASIEYIGAGKNIDCLKNFLIKKIDKKRVGIYSCVENEFSVASDEKAGAAPFDFFESFDFIEKCKEKCDFLVVLYHGGKEFYRYPSPVLQKICHKFVEKGADLVVCQHSHCIGCEEKYNKGTIVYGQGNFLFDLGDDEFWKTSFLIEINDNEVSYIPIEKCGEKVRKAPEDRAKTIMDDFRHRSNQILEDGFIVSSYIDYSKKMEALYFRAFLGMHDGHFIFRVLNRLTKGVWGSFVFGIKFNKKDLYAIYNYLQCEAHRELAIQVIKNRIDMVGRRRKK